jgi:hypothetical protein
MEPEELDFTPPSIVVFAGDWEAYEEALFNIFTETLLNKTLTFQGLPVSLKKMPTYKDKHFVFWHLISEGELEEERTPDLRRCERLGWVGWVIENCEACPDISYWENSRGAQKHIVIWYEKENFVVILAKRNGYYLLKSAYLANAKRVKNFSKERDEFRKKRT